MRYIVLALFAALALCVPSSANAAAACTGYVTNVISYGNGNVMIYGSWRNDWTVICSLKADFKGIDPQVCYAWFSIASSAITENKQTVAYYADITGSECATLPTYASSPAPLYFRLIK